MSAPTSTGRARIRRLLTTTAGGRWVLMPYRFANALRYNANRMRSLLTWSFTSRELTNYTYDLTERNQTHLAAFVAMVAEIEPEVAANYIAELDEDEMLRETVRRWTVSGAHRHIADPVPRYGRRMGWYAIVRARKPRVVIETGVDKGLGTCVLAAAMMRNAAEGHPGTVYGTDIDPSAGSLLTSPYDGAARILYGDSIDSLQRLGVEVDVFIHDSDHSAQYEEREYEIIAPRLTERAILLSDNAHVTDALQRFAGRTSRRFLFFREEPKNHWYAGAGIGAAFRDDRSN